MLRILIFILILLSNSAYANGLTQEAKITYLRVLDAAVDVDLEGDNGSWGCDNRAFRLPKSHQNYDVIISLILSANATQTPIKFWVKSCSGGGHPEIQEIMQGSL